MVCSIDRDYGSQWTVSSGSTLFAILFVKYNCHPFWQQWMCPHVAMEEIFFIRNSGIKGLNNVLFQIQWPSSRNNFDPLKPHFYIVKLVFAGVHVIFLISAQNMDCRYSLEPPRRGGSNEYPQSMFWEEIWKISQFFYVKIFNFWRINFLYIWIGVFS